MASVYLTDFFVFRRREFARSESEAFSGPTNVSGIIACSAGALIGLIMYFRAASLTGVPTIESFVSASAAYALLEKLRAAAGRSRDWRGIAAR